MRAAHRGEHEDEHPEPERGREGVLEQLEAGVGGREVLGHDARADDGRGEKAAAEELGDQPLGKTHGRIVAALHRLPSMLQDPIERGEAEQIARNLKAMADPTRIQLLGLILDAPGERSTVTALAARLGLTQPTVSHHLRVLAEEGLLERTQDGREVWHAIAPARAADVAQSVRTRSRRRRRRGSRARADRRRSRDTLRGRVLPRDRGRDGARELPPARRAREDHPLPAVADRALRRRPAARPRPRRGPGAQRTGSRALRVRAECRSLAAGLSDPALARGRPGRGAHGGVAAGGGDRPEGRRGARRDRRLRRRRVPQAAHRRGRARRRRRRDDGLRRRVPGLPGPPLPRLGSPGPRHAPARRRARGARRHRPPHPRAAARIGRDQTHRRSSML